MLHNTTRLKLLQGQNDYVSWVADGLYFVGLSEYTRFTVQQAIELLTPLGIHPKAIRIALKHPLFQRVGYRSAVYVMPAPSTARKIVQGDQDNPTRDALPRSAFESIKNYRMHILKAFLEKHPGKHYRAFLADLLGVCGATIYNYVRALKIRVTPNIRNHPLSPEWIDKLPTYKYQGRFWLQIFTRDKVIDAPLRLEIALKWLSRGFKVQIAEQCENSYGEISYTSGDYADFIQS